MSSFGRFRAVDLFRLNPINLDLLTENYNLSFYLQYLAQWPDQSIIALNPSFQPIGYILGKTEDARPSSTSIFRSSVTTKAHLTTLTISSSYRRLGLGEKLLRFLEEMTDRVHGALFMDLYVRPSNVIAIKMYTKMGYVVYRRVLKYYGDMIHIHRKRIYPYLDSSKLSVEGESEDAFDMRKSLSGDPQKQYMIPLSRPVHAHDVE